MNHSTRRILYIDDEIPLHAVVRLGLSMQAGWETIATNDGRVGINIARSQQPDAILLDLMMPEIDGITVLKMLKADPIARSIPVILLTAKVETTKNNRIADLGAVGAIAKPFNSLTLAGEIAAILGWTQP